jgi:CRP/FNR family transcriptional regulator, cyclic AMP receptor protein
MKLAVVRGFEKGRIIIQSGEPATRLFLLKTGSVNFYRVTPDGREVLLARLCPG